MLPAIQTREVGILDQAIKWTIRPVMVARTEGEGDAVRFELLHPFDKSRDLHAVHLPRKGIENIPTNANKVELRRLIENPLTPVRPVVKVCGEEEFHGLLNKEDLSTVGHE